MVPVVPPAAAAETAAATASEVPIATQVLAADNVGRLLKVIRRFWLTLPQFDENDSAIGEVFLPSIIII